MTLRGLPRRQRLVGIWLLLSGVSLAGGAAFAAWLDPMLVLNGWQRVMLWVGCLSGGGVILLLGLLLERMLFTPVRHLQVQLARLVATPDTPDEQPPEGWLKGLGPDLRRVHENWRLDRQRLSTARTDGARSAARIRQELEALLQILETPLVLCDQHRRVMLFNQAAEHFFDGNHGLGLGKRLSALLSSPNLEEALTRLPIDGTLRELLIPCDQRWLKVVMRRVPATEGEVLLTFADATASWANEMGVRADMAAMLIPLRQHTADLICAADALIQLRHDHPEEHPLHRGLESIIAEEGEQLGRQVTRLGRLLDDMQHQGERLTPMWSNDFWQALDERLDPQHRLITPIGMPAWFRGDAPALLALLTSLIKHLSDYLPDNGFEGSVWLDNGRVYLDLIWQGQPLPEHALSHWYQQSLDALPLAPRVADVLRQHASDIWSLADPDQDHARIRMPLPATDRLAPPVDTPPRPEFHDFGIAELPSPDTPHAGQAINGLEVVAFDTETTGLDLRRDDTVISIGACRVVNQRLLASEAFDQKVDPKRPIPATSTAIHGLTDQDVAGAPELEEVLVRFKRYVGDAVLLAHNASFDMLAISKGSIRFDMPVLDTLLISRALDEAIDGHDLDSLCERYRLSFPPGTRHTALGDARVTAKLWLALLPRLEARGIDTLDKLLVMQASAFDRDDASAS